MALTRYLLSHNHDISDEMAPPLSQAAFAAVFQTAIALKPQYNHIQVAAVEHPHWRCELKTELSPEDMGVFFGGRS